jgi:acyl-coenzyme A thioesterase PaaI-like protein
VSAAGGPALQDAIPGNHCWGCSPQNKDGLQIKSYWDGDDTVCTWRSRAPFYAGPTHVLNGGIIATLIDCHCVITVIADRYRQEDRKPGTPPDIWCATASLNLNYLRPTPLDAPVTLRARVVDRDGRRSTVHCTLSADGHTCAEGDVVAIVVPESWRAQGP